MSLKEMPRARVLYMSYTGMLEPLGRSQVVAYLLKLAPDYDITLVSFEKKADWQDLSARQAMQARLSQAKIAWHPRRYHKSPTIPATLFDLCTGFLTALWLGLRKRPGVLHGRGDLAALMLAGAQLSSRGRLLYDVRGFWPEERVDARQLTQTSRVFKVLKAIERFNYRRASHIVTLTKAAANIMARREIPQARGTPITVIPTCADLDRFTPPPLLSPGPFTLGYVGSVGTWYLFDESLAFFQAVQRQRPDARLLILNRDGHDLIQSALARHGLDPDTVELHSVSPDMVADQVKRMHAGLCFIKPCFSKLSSAPTKFAEFLGCGVPVAANHGVGDLADIIDSQQCGVALTNFETASLEEGASRLLALAGDPQARARCVDTARAFFSLDTGAATYSSVYRSIPTGAPGRQESPNPKPVENAS